MIPDAGDALLEITAGGFYGMPDAEIRRTFIEQLRHHLGRYPNGIVVLDNVHLLPNGMLGTVFSPLFDGPGYPELPEIDLNRAFFIMTMQLRQLADLTHVIGGRLSELYGGLVSQRVRVFPFMAWGHNDIIQSIWSKLYTLPCRNANVESITFDDHFLEALAYVLLAEQLAETNGFRVARVFDREVAARVAAMISQQRQAEGRASAESWLGRFQTMREYVLPVKRYKIRLALHEMDARLTARIVRENGARAGGDL